ncbi:Putative RING-H2 finger protein ATL21A [Linum perenne]
MTKSIILLIFFSISQIFNPTTAQQSSSSCFTSSCAQTEPTIRFPFRIQARQPTRCGYPGFTLSCGTYNETLISFPGTTPFILRAIDYSKQQLWVNDPANCLAARLLSLDLSSAAPFRGLYDQPFSFFNCSGDYSNYRGMNPIACLSGGNGGGGGGGGDLGRYSVFATSSERVIERLRRQPSCEMVATVMVPMEWPFYEQVTSSDLSEDLRLTWDSPECRRCEARGGRCGLKGNSSRDAVCSHVPRHRLSRAARYVITVGVGIPLLLFSLGALCCVCRRVKRCATSSSSSAATTNNHHQSYPQFNPASVTIPTPSTGLDGPTIESYPKMVLGESRRLPKPDDNTCSICLSEYNPKETLKTIPDCHHLFHAECIDEWLRLNGTCPICRNCPQPVLVVSSSTVTTIEAWS